MSYLNVTFNFTPLSSNCSIYHCPKTIELRLRPAKNDVSPLIDADRVQVGHQITNYRAYPRFEIKFERGPGISEYTVTMFQTVLGNLQPYMEIFRPFIQKKNQFFSHFFKNSLTI